MDGFRGREYGIQEGFMDLGIRIAGLGFGFEVGILIRGFGY